MSFLLQLQLQLQQLINSSKSAFRCISLAVFILSCLGYEVRSNVVTEFDDCPSTFANSGSSLNREEYYTYLLEQSCIRAYALNNTDREIKCAELDEHLADDEDDIWNFERMPYEVQEFYCETACDIWFQEYVPEFEGNQYDACVNPNGTSDSSVDRWCHIENSEQTERVWLQDLSASSVTFFMDNLCKNVSSVVDTLLVPLIYGQYGPQNSSPSPTIAPSIYCEDLVGWEDNSGYTCEDYSNNQWCGSNFNATSENITDSIGKFNLSAFDVCCACGGGNVDLDSLFPPSQIPSMVPSMKSIIDPTPKPTPKQIITSKVVFVFNFGIHLSDPDLNDLADLYSGELNDLIVDEMTRILIENHVDISSANQVNIETPAVMSCDESEASGACFEIEMIVTVTNTNADETTLINSLRNEQVNEYYYSVVPGLAALSNQPVPSPSTAFRQGPMVCIVATIVFSSILVFSA